MEPRLDFVPVAVKLQGGFRVTVRAVRPDDADKLQSAIRAMSDESRYSRFMGTLRELPPALLDQAIQPRAGREMQLVAVAGEGAEETIVAGARYSSGSGSTECEFAVALTDAWQGRGLARHLLELLMQHARASGFTRMEGYILASNTRMLGLARRLGFVTVASAEGPTVRKVRCDLGPAASR